MGLSVVRFGLSLFAYNVPSELKKGCTEPMKTKHLAMVNTDQQNNTT